MQLNSQIIIQTDFCVVSTIIGMVFVRVSVRFYRYIVTRIPILTFYY